ncbi:hypothetical protein RHMOL_Rhmol05G0283100 [Rhododendron molle]|uniref:Uncharacterized protein n=1 Tax=Rhododendron molle TaxID=49168 RepID=A0ACC0NVI9_RHOML|nr:hypothetical protein RHMOL_Rhmol05G0283100 [Rhododendron molle]
MTTLADTKRGIRVDVHDAVEYCQATESEKQVDIQHQATSLERSKGYWERPDHGCVKIDVDGAWLRNSSGEDPAGAGIVVRTATDRFVATQVVNLGMMGSVLCPEAGAMDMLCPTDVDMIIEDICGLAKRFVSCLFRFVRRSANVVADTLASHGVQGSGFKTWEARPPS